MISKEVKDLVKTQVAKGNIEEALKLLVEESKDKKYYNLVITISGKFNELKEKTMLGILENDDEDVQMNQIRYAILDFLDNDDIESITITKEGDKKGFGQKQIMMAVGGTVLVMLVAFFLFTNNSSPDTPMPNGLSASINPCATSEVFFLKGKIDNKHVVGMKLKKNNPKESGVNGHYWYEKWNKKIPIHGKITGTGFVSLTATIIEQDKSKIEKFEGTFTPDCQVTGNWEMDDKVFTFVLDKQ